MMNFYNAQELLKNTQKYDSIYINGQITAIDKKLSLIIDYFNQHGITTLACCQGFTLEQKDNHHGMIAYILFSEPLENTSQLFNFYLLNQDIMEVEYLPEMNFYTLAAKVAVVYGKDNYLEKQSYFNEQFQASWQKFVLADLLG
jgi:hypothetical protein